MISFGNILKLAILLALIANIATGPEDDPVYSPSPPITTPPDYIYNNTVDSYVPRSQDIYIKSQEKPRKWIELTPMEKKEHRKDHLDEDDIRDIVNETMD